jgi:hypothetical protein
MIMNGRYGGIWKEKVVTYFKALTRRCSKVTGKNHDKSQSDEQNNYTSVLVTFTERHVTDYNSDSIQKMN